MSGHWVLFAAYVRREVAWSYASGFDQTGGLFRAYALHEAHRTMHGWHARLRAHGAREMELVGTYRLPEVVRLYVRAAVTSVPRPPRQTSTVTP